MFFVYSYSCKRSPPRSGCMHSRLEADDRTSVHRVAILKGSIFGPELDHFRQVVEIRTSPLDERIARLRGARERAVLHAQDDVADYFHARLAGYLEAVADERATHIPVLCWHACIRFNGTDRRRQLPGASEQGDRIHDHDRRERRTQS